MLVQEQRTYLPIWKMQRFVLWKQSKMDVSRRGKRQSCVTAERSDGAMCIFCCSCQVYLQTLAATYKTKNNTPTAYFIHVKSFFLDVQEAINQITFPLCFRLLCSGRPDFFLGTHVFPPYQATLQHLWSSTVHLSDWAVFFCKGSSQKKRKAAFPGMWHIEPFFSHDRATFWFQNLKSRGQFPC